MDSGRLSRRIFVGCDHASLDSIFATSGQVRPRKARVSLARLVRVSSAGCAVFLSFPEGPSSQYLRFLVPKTILFMVFGTRVLSYWVLGPSGTVSAMPSSGR